MALNVLNKMGEWKMCQNLIKGVKLSVSNKREWLTVPNKRGGWKCMRDIEKSILHIFFQSN